MKFHRIVGLTGVSPDETPQARRWAYILEWPMLIVVLWIPVQWYLEAKGLLPHNVARFDDWVIWTFFFVETVLLTRLVRNKAAYLAENWMNIAIIIAGLPILWNHTPLIGVLRNLRVLLLLALLLRLFPVIRKVLRRNQLGLTLILAFMVALISGVLLSAIDPGIPSISDGIWYAWVTITTVGYGDVVPTTGAGRVIGAILILLGLVLFSLVTANVAAFILSSDVEKVEREETALAKRLDMMQAQLDRIERKLSTAPEERTTHFKRKHE